MAPDARIVEKPEKKMEKMMENVPDPFSGRLTHQ
jgi:hypothetical protein